MNHHTLRILTEVGDERQYPIDKIVEARIINHKVGKVTKAIPKDIQIIPIIAIIGIEIFNVLINQG